MSLINEQPEFVNFYVENYRRCLDFYYVPNIQTQVFYNKKYQLFLFWFNSFEIYNHEIYFVCKNLDRVPDVNPKALPFMYKISFAVLTDMYYLDILNCDWLYKKIVNERIDTEAITGYILMEYYKNKGGINEVNKNRSRENWSFIKY